MTEYLYNRYDLDQDHVTSLIDELPLWSAPFGLKLLDRVPLGHQLRVLDIGFGAGFPLLELAQRLGTSCEVYGIDPWPAGCRRARQKIDLYQLKHVFIQQGAAEDLPFSDGFFDVLVSNNGINNVNDLEQTFLECGRVCKSGGVLLFTVNLAETMIEFYHVLRKVLRNNQLDDSALDRHIHAKRRPVNELVNLASRAGFRISEISYDQVTFRYTDGSAMLNHFLIKLAFLPAWKELVPENRLVSVFDQVEKALNEQAQFIGELRLTIPLALFECKRE